MKFAKVCLAILLNLGFSQFGFSQPDISLIDPYYNGQRLFLNMDHQTWIAITNFGNTNLILTEISVTGENSTDIILIDTPPSPASPLIVK